MSDHEENGRPGYLINRAAMLFRRTREARLRELGVGSGGVPILMALRDGPSLTQKALAEVAGVEQPTMAQALARMERDGMVERTPDLADRRSSLVRLTPVAIERVPALVEALGESNAQALAGFNEAERATLASLLHRVIANLEGTGHGPPSA